MSKRPFVIGECLLVQLARDEFEVSQWCDCIMARRDIGHWHLQGTFSTRADAIAEVQRLEQSQDQPEHQDHQQGDHQGTLDTHSPDANQLEVPNGD